MAELENDAVVNQEMIDALIQMIGRIAGNDGAVAIGPGFHVVGAELILKERERTKPSFTDRPQPFVCYNASGTDRREVASSHGPRHEAAYTFAWSNEDAVVFVVSADGPVTCALRAGNELLTWPVRLLET